MESKTIHQEDNWSCMACAVAMAAGKTLQDVVDYVGYDGSDFDANSRHPEKRAGFGVKDLIMFLVENGYMLGTYGVWKDPPVRLDEKQDVDICWPLKAPGSKSLVTVKSERLHPNSRHVIYYDGETVHDPYRETKKKRLEDYEIYEWWPVMALPIMEAL